MIAEAFTSSILGWATDWTMDMDNLFWGAPNPKSNTIMFA